MGWSRYCETSVVASLSPALFFARPTREAVAVANRMAARAAAEGWPAAAGAAWGVGGGEEGGEGAALSQELLLPAFDGVSRVGASARAPPPADAGCGGPSPPPTVSRCASCPSTAG